MSGFFVGVQRALIESLEERVLELGDELRACESYFEPRAEAQVLGDPPEMTPNAEMVRLMAIRAVLEGRKA